MSRLPQLVLAMEEEVGQGVDQVSLDDVDQVAAAATGLALVAQPV